MKDDEQLSYSFLDIESDIVDDDDELGEQVVAPASLDTTVITEYRAGVTLEQITKSLGISYGKVYEILGRNKVQLRNGSYKSSKSGSRMESMSDLEKVSLIVDYKDGMPLADLLAKYQINKHGCYKILDEAEVPRRKKTDAVPLGVKHIIDAYTKPEVEQGIVSKVEAEAWLVDGGGLHINLSKTLVHQLNYINITVSLKE